MTDNPETPSELSPSDASFWICEIEAAKERASDWYESADEAQQRYDGCEGDDSDESLPFGALNLLWANVETQKAAIGEDFGKPQVTRVNQPENDGGKSRQVALIWERAIAAAVRDSDDNHDIALAVNDIFLPGRGQIWVEVEKTEGDRPWVSAPIVRLPFKDYLHGQADRWGSVPWVARRHLFTRDELVSECKLSREEADKVPLNISLPFKDKKHAPENSKGKAQFKRAEVWEIWTKYPKKARIYIAMEYRDEVLRYDEDPFKLKNFFPCPRPIIANGNECTVPLTDYSRYENQATELDEICGRIFVLTAALQRKGAYDAAFAELGDLAQGEENTLIAVNNWVALQASGGLNKVMEWQDLSPIIVVLVELHKQRDSLIKLIYELSGISDLARGHTDPDETATAQNLKATFGSSRFRRREKESRRFAADAYAIKAEIIAEMFPREQLQEMTGISMPTRKEIADAKRQLKEIVTQYQQAQQGGIQLPPPDQSQIDHLQKTAQTRFAWEDIADVLQSDYRRCYSVECETDQTEFVDQEADKKARTEFFGTVMQAIQQVMPLIAGNPKNGEVFKNLIMFVISSFKAGRAMEEGLERAIDEAVQMAMQQQGQQQPNPEMIAAQAKVQVAQIGLQTAQLKLQTEQLKAQNAGMKAQTEAQMGNLKAIEGQQKTQAMHDQNQAKRAGQEIEMVNKVEQLQFERAQRATAQEAILAGPTQAPKAGAPA